MTHNERLYSLLPAVYKKRDAERGEPLRALFDIMESELENSELALQELYDNWFIETCAEWVAPYIGDLLGVKGLHPGSPGVFSRRAFVADTLALRRRKGTASGLEQLVQNLTGWGARVVEFFTLLQNTQHANHFRDAARTLNLRDSESLDLLGGPFETTARLVDVSANGRYNMPRIGVFLWPVKSRELPRARSRLIETGCYTCDSLGRDIPLFNRIRGESDIASIAGEENLPVPLREFALRKELDDPASKTSYLKGPDPAFAVFADGKRVGVDRLRIDDLAVWKRPTENGTLTLDPKRGRLAFSVDWNPGRTETSYSYACAADLGGGPYNRGESVFGSLPATIDRQKGVRATEDTTDMDPANIESAIGDALTDWNGQSAGTRGLICLLENEIHEGDIEIVVPPDGFLMLVSAGWPLTEDPTGLRAPERRFKNIAPTELRAHIKGSVRIRGASGGSPGRLVLNGLLIEGGIEIQDGTLGRLEIAHCTITGVNPSLQTGATPGETLRISLERSYCGALDLRKASVSLRITESILQENNPLPEGKLINAPQSPTQINACTIFGGGEVRSLEAENSIFMEPIQAIRLQTGCVRYCYLAPDSRTPRAFRTQPAMSLPENPNLSLERRRIIEDRLRPVFLSRDFADPSFARLCREGAEEIRTGAEDGSEMGAFGFLKEQQREANLRSTLPEYLRFGKEAQLIFMEPRKEY